MQRKLKFRLWNDRTKRMDHWFHLDSDDGRPFECSSGSYGDEMSRIPGYSDPVGDHFHIMQFIEKRDRTGKEIYEGDILQCEMYLGEVKFSTDSSFIMTMIDDGKESSFTHHEQLPFHTIIGNIYEGYTELPLT